MKPSNKVERLAHAAIGAMQCNMQGLHNYIERYKALFWAHMQGAFPHKSLLGIF